MSSFSSHPSHPSSNQSRAERIETLLAAVEQIADAHIREQMAELLQSLLDLFGDGLARILELTESAPAGGELLGAFADDELIGSLLVLYGLHPEDLETRLARALDALHPELRAYSASADLLRVTDGVAFVRLDASGKGCSSPLSTLQPQIEQALYAIAPELEGVRFETPSAPPKLISLTPTRRKTASINGASSTSNSNGKNGANGAHPTDQGNGS